MRWILPLIAATPALMTSCSRPARTSPTPAKPRNTITVDVPPGGYTVPFFRGLTVTATVEGDIPPFATITYNESPFDDSTSERIPLVNDRFLYRFRFIRDLTEFHITAGDARSATHRVRITDVPFIDTMSVYYRYPDYVHLPDLHKEYRSFKDLRSFRRAGGSVRALKGTRVRLVFKSAAPLREAAFVTHAVPRWRDRKQRDEPVKTMSDRPKREILKLTSPDRTTFEKTFDVDSEFDWHLELTSKAGKQQRVVFSGGVLVDEDERPRLDLYIVPLHFDTTPESTIEVVYECTDDLGLHTAGLFFRVLGESTQFRPVPTDLCGRIAQSGRDVRGSFICALGQLGVSQEKGLLQFALRASDHCPRPAPAAEVSVVRSLRLRHRFEAPREMVEWLWPPIANARRGRDGAARFSQVATDVQTGRRPLDKEAWAELEREHARASGALRRLERNFRWLADYVKVAELPETDAFTWGVPQAAAWVKALREQGLDPITRALRDARATAGTRSNASQPRAARARALNAVAENGRAARTLFETTLFVLRAWPRLASAISSCRALKQRQEDLLQRTRKVAAGDLGLSILDMTDQQQEEILVLAKRQQKLYSNLQALAGVTVPRGRDVQLALRPEAMHRLDELLRGAVPKELRDRLKRAARLVENVDLVRATQDQQKVIPLLRKTERHLERLRQLFRDGLLAPHARPVRTE